ncbi:MAG: prepilin-type N-terminal cleavage/methylation domain-containing protein [bacterium]
MRKHPAFTLIEILIVVAIIAILAAIAVPNFIHTQLRARIARVQGDFQALGVALESYRVDEGFYPPISQCGAAPPERKSGLWPLKVLTSPVAYIASLPRDPFWPGTEEAEQLPGVNDYGTYWYMDRRTRSIPPCSPSDAASFFAFDSQLWALKSPGPDHAESYDSRESEYGYHFHYVVYEVSNGLDSNGDIYLFGP